MAREALCLDVAQRPDGDGLLQIAAGARGRGGRAGRVVTARGRRPKVNIGGVRSREKAAHDLICTAATANSNRPLARGTCLMRPNRAKENLR